MTSPGPGPSGRVFSPCTWPHQRSDTLPTEACLYLTAKWGRTKPLSTGVTPGVNGPAKQAPEAWAPAPPGPPPLPLHENLFLRALTTSTHFLGQHRTPLLPAPSAEGISATLGARGRHAAHVLSKSTAIRYLPERSPTGHRKKPLNQRGERQHPSPSCI